MYKVVRCLNCKTHQMSTAQKNFSCVKCNKNHNITKMRLYYESQDYRLTLEVLKKLKEEVAKVKNRYDDDFKDAI